MQINTAHTLYEAFGNDRCAFVHAGRFRDEHTADLIALSEAAAELTNAARDVRNRLAFIMVEAYQNVIRHGVPIGNTASDRSFMLMRGGDSGFTVSTTNTMRNEDEARLMLIMGDLQGRSKGQLKELFLERLQGNKVSERGGAGLGLIEMARRSGRDLVHSVVRQDEGSSLFNLQVSIRPNGTVAMDEARDSPDNLQRTVFADDVVLAYKGMLLPAIVQALVRILEKGVDDRQGKSVARVRALYAANELIAELLGPEEEKCIVAIGSNGTEDQLAIGMLMATDQAKELSASVARKNAMSAMEQSRRYREGLLAKANGKPAPGLGLLDLLRSGGGVLHHAEREHAQGSFVTLMIRI
jgi:Family of unknown function (DUF6272)